MPISGQESNNKGLQERTMNASLKKLYGKTPGAVFFTILWDDTKCYDSATFIHAALIF